MKLFNQLLILLLFSYCTVKNNQKEIEILDNQYSFDTITQHTILDSIIYENSKIPDSIILKILWKKSSLFKNRDSVLKYDRLLLKEAKEAKNLYYIAKGYSYLAYDYREEQILDSALYYYQQAKKSYLKLGDSTQVGRKLMNIGNLQYRFNDLFGAKESLTEAIKYFDAKFNEKYIIQCWNTLGNCYAELDDFEKAKIYYKNAIRLEENIQNKIIYSNNLAVLNSDKGYFDNAIQLIDSIIANIPDNYNKKEYSRLIHNKAEAEWKQSKKNVLPDYVNALKIRKQENDLWGLLSSYQSLAEYFEKTKPQQAKKYVDSLTLTSKTIKVPLSELNGLEILMRLYPNNVTYRNRYIFLKDSLYQQEFKVKTQFAKMKYDDEQEKILLKTLELETAQKEVKLSQSREQRLWLLFLLALFILVSIASYYFIQQKNKKEKLQEIYNTEKRISQDLHDGLANDVFGLMTQLQNQKSNNETLMNNLEQIYETTRKISHENASISTGKEFREELGFLISTYQSKDITLVIHGIDTIPWSELSENLCVVIHRSIKELLVNMKKHAKASLASIQFKKDRELLLVTYTDNGIGLDKKKSYGIGLLNTENRINNLGGSFTFGSGENGGAISRITLPI